MIPQHAGADGPAALPLLVTAALYLGAVVAARRRGRGWPRRRTALWLAGTALAAAAVAGPLADRAEHHFPAHMVTHLLLGMVVPLLLVRAAPVTLALRALPPGAARRLSRLLSSRVVRVLGHPVTAAAAVLGGLWLLYTTGLFELSAEQPALHLLVHVHVLLWGYLLTDALVGVDPRRHRTGPGLAVAVLVLSGAGHSVLAKHLWAVPPPGVGVAAGEQGALVMYYGGDAVQLALAVLLCHRWYVRAGRSAHRAGGRGPGVAPAEVGAG